MIEKIYKFTQADEKTIEKVIDDEHINLVHMILNKGESLAKHYSNSNIYMIITRGIMSIKLDDQDFNVHTSGNILNIPYNTHMDVTNKDEEVLEFFVVKAPHPKLYKKD